MSYVEGVGDEVIQFFGIVLVILLATLAWWSTNIRDLPQIRTVLIVERRTQNVMSQQTNVSHSDRFDSGQSDGNSVTVSANSANKSRLPTTNENCSQNLGTGSNDTNTNDVNSEVTTPHTSQSSRHINNNRDEADEAQNQNQSNDDDNIRIRLKYLNDDQKLVVGRLQEHLGEFKRRHFRMELAAQKFVRLIFNGQVLQRDDQTLQGCGLYDNCVVHCLVHNQQNTNRPNGQQHLNSPPPDWNLGGLLYACLSLILALAWICRYNYSHLFTLTTTTALVGLTGMFAVSVIGLYMPDQDQPSSN